MSICCTLKGEWLVLCVCVQALPLFQHSLQLCEANFEPDGVEIAQAFTDIADTYTHISRYGYIQCVEHSSLLNNETTCTKMCTPAGHFAVC